ncbi:MAG: DUF4157 domain-containing protein [Acidobacteriia bacterium]|nr:DUF4157 domain-containing protein [Terriglobia bacterium]
MDATTRTFFEPLFGYDFSQARVHSDRHADESARSVNASAYTVGNDIVFRAGQYAPQTIDGRRLLAHELVHVEQQRATSNSAPSRISEIGSTEDMGVSAAVMADSCAMRASLNFRAKARDNVSSPRSPATAVPTAGVVINLVNISTE